MRDSGKMGQVLAGSRGFMINDMSDLSVLYVLQFRRSFRSCLQLLSICVLKCQLLGCTGVGKGIRA